MYTNQSHPDTQEIKYNSKKVQEKMFLFPRRKQDTAIKLQDSNIQLGL